MIFATAPLAFVQAGRVVALALVAVLLACPVSAAGGKATTARGNGRGVVAFFVKGNGRRYVVVKPLGGGPPRTLELAKEFSDGLVYAVELSKTGRILSFIANDRFFFVDVRSLRIKRILSSPEVRGVWQASVSTDGRRFALVQTTSRGPCGHSDIGVVSIDGSIEHFDALPSALRRFPREGGLIGDPPSWSPEGRRLAYVVSRSEECSSSSAPFTDFLIRVQANGQGAVTLHRAGLVSSPSWSPDGKRIAYVVGRPGASSAANIFAIRPRGTGSRKLTHFVFDRRSPKEVSLSFAWAGNGSLIAAYHQRVRKGAGLYAVDVHSAKTRRFSPLLAGTVYAVSPDGRFCPVAGEAGTYDVPRAITVVAVADGKVLSRTRLIPPRTGLHREMYGPVAVSFAP